MSPQQFRDRLAAARGADAAEMSEMFDLLSAEVCAALAARNGSPPAVVDGLDDVEPRPLRAEPHGVRRAS